MAGISKYNYKPISISVFGKNRIIREIAYYAEHYLIAKYRNHDIYIAEQDTGGFEVKIINLDTAIFLEEKYYSSDEHETLLKMIEKCIETILLSYHTKL